jgi:glutaredoxin
MPRLELFGSAGCPHTKEMRDWLEWRGEDFVEYDVESDAAARARLRHLTGGQRTVPVLVEAGRVVQIGWHGRGCVIGGE